MAKPRYVGTAPKRYKQKRARLWLFDFRGIQGRKPSKDMLRRMKQPYRSYRGNKPEDKLYSAILKRAKQRIALYSEERLYDREGVVGAKFVLDHHFKALTNKEAAEIEAMNKNLEYKAQELEMKKQMLDLDDEDNSLNITIVRKEE